VVFDIDPAIGLARSKRRLSESGSDEGRFEDLDLAFHQRVRAGFLAEAEASGRDHVVIDATRPVAEIAAEIAGLVDGVMGAGSSG
jgi:dTMP kinase